MSASLQNLELLLAFEDWATPRGYDMTRNQENFEFQNIETRAAWLGFEAAHGPAGCRPYGQQLYAEIKKNSKYAHQADWCRTQGYGYPFKVRIAFDKDGYSVKGGVGGQYRLEDVNLYVLEDGKKIRVR